nr:FecR domain-containing protein [Dechloromonas sp.]
MTTTRPCRISHLLSLALFCLTCLQTPAQAETQQMPSADTGKPFASVWRVRGEVFATNQRGSERLLKEGGNVLVGERVRASNTGEAVLRTADGGMVAIRPAASFVPEQFAAEGKSTDRQILRLITGSLRVISGWIARINPRDHRIHTPSATIGIRGTDHEPYVLPVEFANATYQAGTYDKVNRGGVALEASGGSVEINPGRVGFARDPQSVAKRTRALMTMLLPTLLDRVPDFYVAGAFDGELDRYSEKLAGTANSGASGDAPLPAAAPAPTAASVAPEAVLDVAALGCTPQLVGEYWLKRLDSALMRRDLKNLLALFAPDVTTRATIRKQDNSTQVLEFTRDELVQSTLRSISSLKNYHQRRLSIESRAKDNTAGATCPGVEVTSQVIEQGLLGDRPYRFESTETYLLELRNGEWLATRAETVQR